jgi:broad specificity phosphatase PhoE
MTARLIIVRHGNTFNHGEAPRRIGARTDLPLVESGRAQAARLASWFAAQGLRFNRVLSSPLRRTRETAEILLAMQVAPPVVEPSVLLAEIDHGPDENQPEQIVLARIGTEAMDAWDCEGVAPPGWTVECNARLAGWAALLGDMCPSTTLLVTSNGAARFALMAHPNLAKQAAALPSLKLRTGAFGLIEVNADGPQLMRWDERP